tara:strand:+ start:2145 stop:2624 length:480 start_codon:yes stop_codon:yes gene_type:complete
MKLALIVAVAKNDVIGYQGQIPWHISEDLKYFKRVTSGHPVVMGRKTFESIGRPLPNRRNIVVTRQLDYHAEGIEVVHSLAEATSKIQQDEQVFVIGGQSLYEEALPLAQALYVTEVDMQVEGDTFFPHWAKHEWSLMHQETHQTQDGIGFSFLQYQRV